MFIVETQIEDGSGGLYTSQVRIQDFSANVDC